MAPKSATASKAPASQASKAPAAASKAPAKVCRLSFSTVLPPRRIGRMALQI